MGYYITETYTYEVTESKEEFTGFEDITICRPKLIYFKVTGMRPNTRHFAFVDNTDVTNYINTSIATINDFKNLSRNDILRNPGEKYINETGFPTELGGPTAAIYSDDEGKIEGVFYLQSNDTLNFPAGVRTVSFIDISLLNREEALSYGEGIYSANGGIENYDTVYYTVTKTGTRQVWVNYNNGGSDSPPYNSGGGNSNGTPGATYPGPTVPTPNPNRGLQPPDRGFGRSSYSGGSRSSGNSIHSSTSSSGLRNGGWSDEGY